MLNYLTSAVIYLSVFCASLGLCFIAEHLTESGLREDTASVKPLKALFYALALLLPCVLAATRADTVGVDVKVYVAPFSARAAACPGYWEVYNLAYGDVEHLYALLLYLTSRFTSDSWLMLFCLQAMTIIPVFFAAKRFEDKLSVTHAMAIYLFVFYNNSLNLMRQSAACALIMLGTAILLTAKRRPLLKAAVPYLFAGLFHKSGVIGIFVILLLYASTKLKVKRVFRILIMTVIVILPLILVYVFEFLVSVGFLDNHFLIYGDIFLYKTRESSYIVQNVFSPYFLINVAFNVGLFALPTLFAWRSDLKKDAVFDFFRFLVFIGLAIFTVILYSMKTPYGGRLSLYFDMMVILYFPYSLTAPNKGLKKNLFFVYILVYWLVWVLVMGWSGSNLYEFRF